ALLPWESSTLLDHTLDRLRAVCGERKILCGPEGRYADRGVPIVRDVVPGAGPLAGLVSGLEELGDAPGLFLAVDMPLVPGPLLRVLLEWVHGHDGVVPVTADGAHPLCAVYRGRCLEPARRRLASGERRMTCFWPDVRIRQVGEPELAAFGDPALLMRNVNSA